MLEKKGRYRPINILEIQNVSKTFSRTLKKEGEESQEKRAILKKVSLEIEQGKITALIGGNGSGKTTLFNIISGLTEPGSGEILLNKKKITKLSEYKRTRNGIGRLFQDNHIFPNLSILDNMLVSSGNLNIENPFFSFIKYRLTT